MKGMKPDGRDIAEITVLFESYRAELLELLESLPDHSVSRHSEAGEKLAAHAKKVKGQVVRS